MSKLAIALKRVSVALLCLLIFISIAFVGTEKVAAGAYLEEVDLFTRQPLYRNADIKEFLDSVTLNVPDIGVVEKFEYYLYYMEGGNPVYVTSGKATKSNYQFELDITLKESYFDSHDKLYVALNDVEADFIGAIEAGSRDLYARWNIKPIPTYKVTFKTDGGKPVPPTQWVIEGDMVDVPKKPTKKGYEFLGWWHDVPRFSEEWDFERGLYQDLPLIARWKALPTTTTTPVVIEITTSTTPVEITTTTSEAEETFDPMTTSDVFTDDSSPDESLPDESSPAENSETTSPTGETETKKGFNFKTILYILGGAVLFISFGTIIFILGRKSK